MTKNENLPKLRRCTFADLSMFCHQISYRLSGAKEDAEDSEEISKHGWRILEEAVADHYKRPSAAETAKTAKQESKLKRLAKANEAKAKSGSKGGRPRKERKP